MDLFSGRERGGTARDGAGFLRRPGEGDIVFSTDMGVGFSSK